MRRFAGQDLTHSRGLLTVARPCWILTSFLIPRSGANLPDHSRGLNGGVDTAERYGYGDDVPPGASAEANRRWWDGDSAAYTAEHGSFLGGPAGEFVWGPEGRTETELGLLGPLRGTDVLDMGCGAAQTTRWLTAQGARTVGFDVSFGMLTSGPGASVPLVQADCTRLPFASHAFDVVCSAFGGIPFVDDSAAVMRETARVLRPGGRFVFSVTHPIRWAFPDVPGEAGLTAHRSYFDRRPYREFDDDGTLAYAEHHRTLGDRVRELVAAGFTLLDIVEPEWPERNLAAWGGWSPLRGKLLPGTAIFVAGARPAARGWSS